MRCRQSSPMWASMSFLGGAQRFSFAVRFFGRDHEGDRCSVRWCLGFSSERRSGSLQRGAVNGNPDLLEHIILCPLTSSVRVARGIDPSLGGAPQASGDPLLGADHDLTHWPSVPGLCPCNLVLGAVLCAPPDSDS